MEFFCLLGDLILKRRKRQNASARYIEYALTYPPWTGSGCQCCCLALCSFKNSQNFPHGKYQ